MVGIHWLHVKGDVKGASLLLSDMINKHICLDQFTHSILTKGLYRNGYINEALKYHKSILEKNRVEEALTCNILINYLCRNKDTEGAKQLLGIMFVRRMNLELVTYGTLIDGHNKEGSIEEHFRFMTR